MGHYEAQRHYACGNVSRRIFARKSNMAIDHAKRNEGAAQPTDVDVAAEREIAR